MLGLLQVHCLSGHDETVASILTQGTDPQVGCSAIPLAPPPPPLPRPPSRSTASQVPVCTGHLRSGNSKWTVWTFISSIAQTP